MPYDETFSLINNGDKNFGYGTVLVWQVDECYHSRTRYIVFDSLQPILRLDYLQVARNL